MIDLSSAESASDEELVKLTLESQDNFLYLVDRYKGRLTSYIRRLTNISGEDAEDTLQEIFIKVYLNLNDFNRDLKFSSWIYRIAHNQVISNHRKLKARPEGYKVNIDDVAARNLAADINIMAGADLQILKTNIFKILNKLEEKYREVLVLKFLEEKNYQEISDILKKPAGTVASTINKAKQEFKKELAKQKIIL
ncbi:MAG: sigma-70 family RNA polymerase sigma factor [Patescibacteria group bacterium]|jgi:RNA polymerase sigma-70 factor (ECF subfamily)